MTSIVSSTHNQPIQKTAEHITQSEEETKTIGCDDIIELNKEPNVSTKYDINDDKENTQSIVDYNQHIFELKEQMEPTQDIVGISISEFITPRIDDYIDCDRDVKNCPATNRIFYLLNHHKATHKISNILPIGKDYDLPNVMEDWFHFKQCHFDDPFDIEYIENNNAINCSVIDMEKCSYLKRYQRQRDHEIYPMNINQEIDYKQIILLDHIDSIHCYLFHSASRRLGVAIRNKYYTSFLKQQNDDDDDVNEEKYSDEKQSVWLHKPRSISECNVKQIVYIMNHLEIIENLSKLKALKSEIITFINKHEMDGQKLTALTRKEFIDEFVGYFDGNKQLRAHAGSLYTKVIKCHVCDVFGNNECEDKENAVWLHKPQSISECNIQQIVYVLKNTEIIDSLNKLKALKDEIITFIKENKMDGHKLHALSRKGFMNKLIEHFDGNNKLKLESAKLYSLIMKYDLSIIFLNNKQDIWSNSPQSIAECNTQQIVYILHDIMNNSDQLTLYKEGIIGYITEHVFDGDKCIKMQQKEFVSIILKNVLHNDETLNSEIETLYNKMIQYDVSKCISKGIQEIEEVKQETVYPTDSDTLNSNQKFITSTESTGSYYAFGEQYRYTENLSNHPLYIKPKYSDLQEELIEYFTEINGRSDAGILSCSQKERIKSMEPYPQEISLALIQDKDDELQHVIRKHYKSNMDEHKEELVNIVHLEDINCNRIRDIMHTLLDHLPNKFEFYSNCVLVKLLDLNYNYLNDRITEQITVSLKNMGEDKFKDLRKQIKKSWSDFNKKDIEEIETKEFKAIFSILNGILKDAFCSDPELSTFLPERLLHKGEQLRYLWQSFIHNRYPNIYAFTKILKNIIGFTNFKLLFFEKHIKPRCKKFALLERMAKQWTLKRKISVKKAWFDLSSTDKAEQFSKIFDIQQFCNYSKLDEAVQSEFIILSTETMNKMSILNQKYYIQYVNKQRLEGHMEKACIQVHTSFVKRLKAVWYHGINEDHGILPGSPLTVKHITAMICYTHNSRLCTDLRETYRRKNKEENIWQQKERHASFSNMGRLLYESFVFFASKDTKIKILYHGMSQELLFPTLYCAFDAPTSTTTAQSVASSFCRDTGMVLAFTSADSSNYIRTLDMGLFSCFDAEHEHLIFETRLHIQDMFLPKEIRWIGSDIMRTLSLYDLLVHGNMIHHKYLLKKKYQNKLWNVLNLIMTGHISTKISSPYLVSLIHSLSIKNKKIWINSKQIDELQPKLKQLFVAEDGGFGEFLKYLINEHNVKLYPVFLSQWTMSMDTFDLIDRITKKYDNMRLRGLPVTLHISNDKIISFRPQLTKVKDFFDVEMQLTNVTDNKPIYLHFNLECIELDNYYTSLHPRVMDVDYNNKWHITLPSFDRKENHIETISLNMFIMLHNFEHFNTEYNDLSALNITCMKQEMIPTKKSYKYADHLSIFYGASNSFFSVFDSISDILFVGYLLYFAGYDNIFLS